MKRAYALDALRGLAIILMVLSSMEVFGILPAWMYHAQVPPPDHVFNPNLPGITWVDLVFPFFLFAMGAAFPFSVGRRLEKGESRGRVAWDIILRALRLVVFAIFVQHFYPYMLRSPQDPQAWGLALAAWAVLFLMFLRLPSSLPEWVERVMHGLGYAVALAMSCLVTFASTPNLVQAPMTFLATSNIILLVLANLSFFGGLTYLFTMDRMPVRLLVLVVLALLAVSGLIFDESWLRKALDWSPAPWLTRFDFLKYMFIVIPGSIAGDCLKAWMQDRVNLIPTRPWRAWVMLFLPWVILVVNLVCLFGRYLVVNAVATVLLCGVGIWVTSQSESNNEVLWRRMFLLGSVLLLLGLCVEPLQGGIKKDHATFSYLFVMSGLASMILTSLHVLCDHFGCLKSTAFLRLTGQNPMIAYVSGQLFVLPLLQLAGLAAPLFALCGGSPWLGFFLQGVGLKALTVLVTMFFSHFKLYWRT